MMTLFVRRLLIVALVLSTASCGNFPICCLIEERHPEVKSQSELLFDYRYRQLVQLDNWKIKGRSVITQGSEGWNVGLKWQENTGRYQIKLEGPFAQGGARLDGDKKLVTLTLNDGQQHSATTPEELITKIIGWKLPVSALRDWVRGIPYSEKSSELMEFNERGQLIHLVQDQWDIEFLRYIPFETYSMPAKVFIKHPELSVKLIITDWDRP